MKLEQLHADNITEKWENVLSKISFCSKQVITREFNLFSNSPIIFLVHIT